MRINNNISSLIHTSTPRKQTQVGFTGNAQKTPAFQMNFWGKFGESVGKLVENPESAMKHLDFTGHNMSLPVLALFTAGIILGARLYQARDNNERREVATRDFSAVVTILFALPIFRKVSATIVKKISGMPISYGEPTILNYLKDKDGIKALTFENLANWYSKTGDKKEDLVKFCEHINKKGGNLEKIFSYLGTESKTALQGIATGTNEDIIKNIKEADEKLLKSALEELNSPENNLLKRAKFLRSVPEGMGILMIAGFLGWFLPWFNIIYTKQLYKNNPDGVAKHGWVNQAHSNTSQKSTGNRVNINNVPKDVYAEFIK